MLICKFLTEVSVKREYLQRPQLQHHCTSLRCADLYRSIFRTSCNQMTYAQHNQLSSWVEQGLTSHQTHYRSYRDGFLWVKWPNQQCQSTEGRHM